MSPDGGSIKFEQPRFGDNIIYKRPPEILGRQLQQREEFEGQLQVVQCPGQGSLGDDDGCDETHDDDDADDGDDCDDDGVDDDAGADDGDGDDAAC
eukprot:9423240-Pyramimonas_sp.AAC.1